jgi:hypothetical protein
VSLISSAVVELGLLAHAANEYTSSLETGASHSSASRGEIKNTYPTEIDTIQSLSHKL